MADHHGSTEAGPIARRGDHRTPRRATADPRRDAARRELFVGPRSVLDDAADLRALQHWRVFTEKPLRATSFHDPRRRRARAAHRLRERRESVARARGREASGVERSAGHGRVTMASRSAAVGRESHLVERRRTSGRGDCAMDESMARARAVDADESRVSRSHDRWARAPVHHRRDRADHVALRHGARAAGGGHIAHRCDQGTGARHGGQWRHHRGPRPRRGPGRPVRGPPRWRWSLHPHVQHAGESSSWFRSGSDLDRRRQRSANHH